MRKQLFFILFLLFGINSAAQELAGPDRTLPGTLASFEIVPAQEASWHIVPPVLDVETHQVDTGLAKLYFSSPERGRYTVIAGIVVDGKPTLLVKTFINGAEDEKPIPTPIPPISSLESWIKTQLPILVKSKNVDSEVHIVAERFGEIVRRIDEENIKTASNAQAQLLIALTASLAQASPTAVTDWSPFLAELSRRLDLELDDKINDLVTVKSVLQAVCHAMKSLEMPKNSATVLQSITNPSNRPNNREVQNRTFRNLLAQ